MDSKHLAILKFLSEQKEPVYIDDFPNYITSMYVPGIGNRSFYFEIMETLKNMEWIKEVNFNDYEISDYGKEALVRNNPPSPKYEQNMLDFAIELKRREFETYGDIKTQPLLPKDLQAENPIIQPKQAARKITPMTILTTLWDVINKNLIVSGIIVAIVSAIILKHFHII